MRLPTAVLALSSLVLFAACAGEEAPPPADGGDAAPEAADDAPSRFEADVSGNVEMRFEGSGSLRCVDLGDSGEGYLVLEGRNGGQTIGFEMPLDAGTGTHDLTASIQVPASGGLPGDRWAVEVSLPLEGFHRAMTAEGTLTLDRFGASPGDRVQGSFDFQADGAASGTSSFSGGFDFRVAEGAREAC